MVPSRCTLLQVHILYSSVLELDSIALTSFDPAQPALHRLINTQRLSMNTLEKRHLYVAFWAHSYGSHSCFQFTSVYLALCQKQIPTVETYFQSLQHHQLRCLRVAHHALVLSQGVHPLGDCMGLHQAHDDQVPYQGTQAWCLTSDNTGPLLLLPHIESGTA